MRAEFERIVERLKEAGGKKAVIVGIGNVLKGDDGAGAVICERIKDKITADVIDAGTVPENYIQKIAKQSPEIVLVIDAIDFGASTGDLKILKPEDLSSTITSTHSLSPRIFARLLSQQANAKVFFIGIQPKQVQLGTPLSEEVSKSVDVLVEILVSVFKK